ILLIIRLNTKSLMLTTSSQTSIFFFFSLDLESVLLSSITYPPLYTSLSLTIMFFSLTTKYLFRISQASFSDNVFSHILCEYVQNNHDILKEEIQCKINRKTFKDLIKCNPK